MAEVSTALHFFHQPIINVQEQDSDLYAFDFDHLSPPNISFVLPSDSDSLSDSDPNCFDGAQEDQMIFVTDLFASREEEFAVDDVHDLTRDVNYRVLDVWSYGEELGLGLGFRSRVESELGEPSSSIRAATDGLRVVGSQSDSDSDSEEVVQDVNSEDPIRDSDIPLFSDCLVFDEQRSGNEELEWEEVDQRVYEGEGLSSVIDRIEELSVSSVVSSNEERYESGEESVWNFEWEVLLAVNNWERAPQFEHEGDSDGVSYLAFQDDYTYAVEYDTLFGHFVQNENALKGSPPASKYVVENLLTLVMTKEMLQENMVCAVCKDDILVKEKVTRLPCCHHYHGDCIVPWLSIRNTCPVCRYELPTDDLDYEQRKTQTGGLGLSQDFKVGNFRVEPSGLFRGRGEHPKMGKLKRRIQLRDITINIGKDAPIPECPIPGERWKEIRHDNTVTWFAFWNDRINPKEFKYVFLAASSSLKGQSGKEKYEKSRMLKIKDFLEFLYEKLKLEQILQPPIIASIFPE